VRRYVRALVVVALLVSAGCSRGAAVASSDEYFHGLDPSAVAEVLANPVAMQKISEEPPGTRGSMAQGIVINFLVCRDAARVYRKWIRVGVRPSLAPLPVPEVPMTPSYPDWERSYADLKGRIASGDIDQLRFWLTAEGSCGRWIPAEPYDVSGPTISEALEAGS